MPMQTELMQRRLSSQAWPGLTATSWHLPAMHSPLLQGPLRALQEVVLFWQFPLPSHMFTVHPLPGPHVVFAAALTVLHVPVASSHEDVLQGGKVWRRLRQTKGVPLHVPLRHTSF